MGRFLLRVQRLYADTLVVTTHPHWLLEVVHVWAIIRLWVGWSAAIFKINIKGRRAVAREEINPSPL